MSLKGLIHGDVERSKAKYSRPGLEWSEEWPPENDTYDLIVLDHFLQTTKRSEVGKVVNFYTHLLKIGGELIIIVPGLQWAVTEIAMKDNPPLMAYMSIFGSDTDDFKCGLTLNWLRILVESIQELRLLSASGEWYIASVAGKEEKVMQNVVHCQRRLVDATEAIE